MSAVVVILLFLLIAGTTAATSIAHNATARLTCRGKVPYPLWYMNETLSQTPQYSAQIDHSTMTFLGILVIDGNEVCCTTDLRCTVNDQIMYTTRLTIQGLFVFLCVDQSTVY